MRYLKDTEDRVVCAEGMFAAMQRAVRPIIVVLSSGWYSPTDLERAAEVRTKQSFWMQEKYEDAATLCQQALATLDTMPTFGRVRRWPDEHTTPGEDAAQDLFGETEGMVAALLVSCRLLANNSDGLSEPPDADVARRGIETITAWLSDRFRTWDTVHNWYPHTADQLVEV